MVAEVTVIIDSMLCQTHIVAQADLTAPPRRWRLVDTPKPEAGFASPCADYAESVIDLNELMVRNPPATFFARVSGSSLAGLGILSGDIVAVDRSLNPSPGDVVVAVYQGDSYIKVFERVSGRPALVSRPVPPDRFPHLMVDEDENCIIWGVVTGLVRGLRHRV